MMSEWLWSRLNFSDEDLIGSLSSSTFNLHLSFGRFLTFHRSCGSLHSLFKAPKLLKNKGKSWINKGSDDFYNVYRIEHWRVTSHKRYAHRERRYGLFLYCRWFLQSFLTQRGKRLSAGVDDGGRVISVHFIRSFLLFLRFPFVKTVICHTFDEWKWGISGFYA